MDKAGLMKRQGGSLRGSLGESMRMPNSAHGWSNASKRPKNKGRWQIIPATVRKVSSSAPV